MPLTIAMNDLQPEWQEVLLKMTANDRVLLWYFPEETSLQSYQSSPPILYELLLLEVH
jgi:hypothetical protein